MFYKKVIQLSANTELPVSDSHNTFAKISFADSTLPQAGAKITGTIKTGENTQVTSPMSVIGDKDLKLVDAITVKTQIYTLDTVGYNSIKCDTPCVVILYSEDV